MKKKLLISVIFVLFSTILMVEISYAYNNSFSQNPQKSYYNIKPTLYYDILDFNIINAEIYMAPHDITKIKYNLETSNNYEEEISFSSKNPNIATVDQNGNIKSLSNGETEISMKVKDEVRTAKVLVTNLIEKNNPNPNKTAVGCQTYTEEDNDILDKILKSRVVEAGLGTRAGVIAAARFLTLEFPYRITYFSENGRLTSFNNTSYVDGEGRYYHEGLYLHKSRYKNIKKSSTGPAPWRCSIYSIPAKALRNNGLDCSGFISWVFYNGGLDPGDIGAGITGNFDFTDLGTKVLLKSAVENNTLKVGDLLSGASRNGGHIAILIGINNGRYYVAESLWGGIAYGAVAMTYTKEGLTRNFYWQVTMDDYYQKEGNLTNFW